MLSQKLPSSFFLPHHVPCLISLPFAVIHLSLIFFLPLPPTVLFSFCFFSVLLHFPPSLQVSLLAPQQLINLPEKLRSPRRYRCKGKGAEINQDSSWRRATAVTSFWRVQRLMGDHHYLSCSTLPCPCVFLSSWEEAQPLSSDFMATFTLSADHMALDCCPDCQFDYENQTSPSEQKQTAGLDSRHIKVHVHIIKHRQMLPYSRGIFQLSWLYALCENQ